MDLLAIAVAVAAFAFLLALVEALDRMQAAMAHERFDRLVVAAALGRSEGLHTDDIGWRLDDAPGEVVVVRPRADDRLDPRRRLRLEAA